MRVRIWTDHGIMEVELEKFFPASQADTRKLFKLMRRGMRPEKLAEVRRFLEERGPFAAEVKQAAEQEAESLRTYQEELDRRIRDLKQRYKTNQSRIRDLGTQIRLAEAVEKQTPSWLRLFDEIC